jgi:hypothetical protein
MIKEFSEILIVSSNVLDKVIRDHQRRWVFRILSKIGADTGQASILYPQDGDIKRSEWSDFLIRNGISIAYNLKQQIVFFYSLTAKEMLGKWHDPERVRSKVHKPDEHVLLFKYAEPG